MKLPDKAEAALREQCDEWGFPGSFKEELVAEVTRLVGEPLEWTRNLPTIPGIYMRNNPPAQAVVRAFIFDLDGVLRLQLSDGPIDLEKRRGAFLWFGPIPQVPDALKPEAGVNDGR